MRPSAYPAPGHVFEADFGELAFHLKFDPDGRSLRFAPAAEPNFDTAETAVYKATEVRPDLFMVTWNEAEGTTVTHV